MNNRQKKEAELKKEREDFFDSAVEFSQEVRDQLGRDDVVIVLTYPQPGKTGPVNYYSTCEKQLAAMVMAQAANQLMSQVKKDQ